MQQFIHLHSIGTHSQTKNNNFFFHSQIYSTEPLSIKIKEENDQFKILTGKKKKKAYSNEKLNISIFLLL